MNQRKSDENSRMLINFEAGLKIMAEAIKPTDGFDEFVIYEAALLTNLQSEKRYGSTENLRYERSRLLEQLNGLALSKLDISFNELCKPTSLSKKVPVNDVFQTSPSIKSISQSFNNIYIFMTERSKYTFQSVHNLQINENGATGIQNNRFDDDKIKETLSDLEQVITDLQHQYPQATEEETIPIIEAEFQEIKINQPQRWQKFLNLKRIWTGLRSTFLKTSEHLANENIWVIGVIGFLEGVTDEID